MSNYFEPMLPGAEDWGNNQSALPGMDFDSMVTPPDDDDLPTGAAASAAGSSTVDRIPAPITVSPTTTTNPTRPRTVAAGYSKSRQVLTVIFRDGTWWNYYNVPGNVWQAFKLAHSKGWYLHASGLDQWATMGPADLSVLTSGEVKAMQSHARAWQARYGGMTAGDSIRKTYSAERVARRMREDAKIKREGVTDPYSGKIANPYTGKVKRATPSYGKPPKRK